MNKSLTVGQLKEALKDVPDNIPVVLSSDTGVDQGDEGEIVVLSAGRHNYTLPDGQVFEDTGKNYVDEFWIYCNEIVEDDDND